MFRIARCDLKEPWVDLDREQRHRGAAADRARAAGADPDPARSDRGAEPGDRRLRGKPGDPQLTLKMLDELQAKAKAAEEALAKAEAAEEARGPIAARRAATSSGPTAQPRLPIVEREFALDDADRTCPSCGGGLAPMKGQFEESEMIDVVEVSYELVKVKQQKYVCRCGGCVETALGPERALPGSRYSLAFAIKVVLDKWLDHIPLERQCRILERHGLVVTSQTLVGSRVRGRAATRARRRRARDARARAAGDRPRSDRLASPRNRRDQAMADVGADGAGRRRASDSRRQERRDVHALVGDYHGTIVADALGTHEAGARDSPGIVLAGCWAHYPERVVIPSWLPPTVAACDGSHKISEATMRRARASIRRASHSDADPARRPRESGDRGLARRRSAVVDDRRVPRLGSPMARALLRSPHRRAAAPNARGRCDLHVHAGRPSQTPSRGAGL